MQLTPEQARAFVAPRRMLLWASVHADGSGHPYHTHADAVLSGVYFLSGGGDGGGDFMAAGGATAPASTAAASEYAIPPSEGRLALFPSWMPHRVAPSDLPRATPRVSLSFNLEGGWHEAPAQQHLRLGWEEHAAAVEGVARPGRARSGAAPERPPLHGHRLKVALFVRAPHA